MRKTIAWICLVIALGALIYWYATGAHVWTQTQVPVEVKDELFDTTSITWKDELRLGLDWLGSVAAGLIAVALGLFWLDARARKRAAPAA